nr:capsid maturation protease UL26 [Psittacid alphaherpesvirus 6]
MVAQQDADASGVKTTTNGEDPSWGVEDWGEGSDEAGGTSSALGNDWGSKDYPPVYVAGYLVLYGRDGDGELAVSKEDVTAALPPSTPLPINVDHRRDCTIGSVLSLVDDDLGLFFVGKIDCPRLAEVLFGAAKDEIFGKRGGGMVDSEKLLYLIANYLPSASLSSRRLVTGERADETFFDHVALCLLGRRVGTVVAYDSSVAGVVKPFSRLSENARFLALREASSTEETLLGVRWDPDPKALGRALLGTAVNSMLLKDRWRVVSERRRQAGIQGHKYLQASTTTVFPTLVSSVPDDCRERPRRKEGVCFVAGGGTKGGTADVDESADTETIQRDLSVLEEASLSSPEKTGLGSNIAGSTYTDSNSKQDVLPASVPSGEQSERGMSCGILPLGPAAFPSQSGITPASTQTSTQDRTTTVDTQHQPTSEKTIPQTPTGFVFLPVDTFNQLISKPPSKETQQVGSPTEKTQIRPSNMALWGQYVPTPSGAGAVGTTGLQWPQSSPSNSLVGQTPYVPGALPGQYASQGSVVPYGYLAPCGIPNAQGVVGQPVNGTVFGSNVGLEQKLNALLDVMCSERGIPPQSRWHAPWKQADSYQHPVHQYGYRPPVPVDHSVAETRGRKRTYDTSHGSPYESEQLYYPGESLDKKWWDERGPKAHRPWNDDHDDRSTWVGQNRDRGASCYGPYETDRYTRPRDDALTGLFGTVSSLQRDVENIKAMNMGNCAQRGQYDNSGLNGMLQTRMQMSSSAGHNMPQSQQQPQPGFPQKPMQGTLQQHPDQNSTTSDNESNCVDVYGERNDADHTESTNQSQQQIVGTIPCQPSQQRKSAGRREGVTSRRLATPANTSSREANGLPETVDASSIQRLNVRTGDPAADVFVEHMMGQR